MDLPRLSSIISSSRFTKVLHPFRGNLSSPATIRTLNSPRSIQCNALTLVSDDDNSKNSQTQKTDRQIVTNYEPSIWRHGYIQSLNSEYK
ncbi:hypothetical protein PIB30_071539, partial [Stylosanthes scabra]|nr:hypothetical protein [Stylosanthes scabra]